MDRSKRSRVGQWRDLGYRPAWHRATGWIVLILGFGIVAANDAMLIADVRLLPGGHSELYLVAGLIVAAGSIWWFGWMDRPSR